MSAVSFTRLLEIHHHSTGVLISAAGIVAVLGVLAALLVARPIEAQGNNVHTEWAVGGGVSFAGGDTATSAGPGLAGHLGLRHRRENLVLSIRMGTNFGGSAPGVRIPGGLRDRFDEIAMMAGYVVHSSEESQVVLSTEIPSVSGERVGTGPAPHFGRMNVPFKVTIGVPVQLAISAIGGIPGFGLTLHTNINPEEVLARSR